VFAAVIEPERPDEGAAPEVQLTTSKPADLVDDISIGSGIRVEIDLARPRQWRSVSVAQWDGADLTLLVALIGPNASERLARLRDERHSSQRLAASEAEASLDVQPTDAWLRLAVIDALDRWLQLPLDQSLVDAERAVARGRAARTLPSGPARDRLVGEALVMARIASKGLANYLIGLAESTPVPPQPLLDRLDDIVGGYAGLGREVVDGPDPELDEVAEAWAMLTAALPAAHRSAGLDTRRLETTESAPDAVVDDSPLASRIDPRQVRARVVDVSPVAGEIRMESTRLGEEPALLVTVPAYGARLPSTTVADRLLVRLVDNTSAEVHGTALLTLAPGAVSDAESSAAAPVFTGVVPLHGAVPEDLRADVFDAHSEVPPAPADTDTDLLRVRRAAYVLREWRRAAAEQHLTGDSDTRQRRLAHLVHRVTPAMAHSDEPVFHGGPTLVQLAARTELGAPDPDPEQSWFGTTQGVGDFLVAELAAVNDIH